MKISILGASSGFGAELAAQALVGGHSVTAISRSPNDLRLRHGDHPGLTARKANSKSVATLSECYAGADVVVFALNAPYEDWDPFMVQTLAATLAAIATLTPKPRLVFPGNIYALGLPIEATINESAPNRPISRKGRLRDKMEKMLHAAAANGTQILIARFADFFGPTVRNGMVDRIFGNALFGKSIDLIGPSVVAHQLTYVPDAARAVLMLLQDPQDAPVTILNVPTHIVASMSDFSKDVARSACVPSLKLRRTPWFMVKLLGLFVPLMKELAEMRYLFDQSILLDGRKLSQNLPRFTPTPMADAIAATLNSYRAAS